MSLDLNLKVPVDHYLMIVVLLYKYNSGGEISIINLISEVSDEIITVR